MNRLRRAAGIAGTYVAAFVGGLFAAAALALLAAWITIKLSGLGDNPDPAMGDGLVLLPPLMMGSVVGFWGGVCLVIYGLQKLNQARARKKIMQINS